MVETNSALMKCIHPSELNYLEVLTTIYICIYSLDRSFLIITIFKFTTTYINNNNNKYKK